MPNIQRLRNLQLAQGTSFSYPALQMPMHAVRQVSIGRFATADGSDCSLKGKGKRGGARIIYLLLRLDGIVYLFYAYTKGDIEDMSPEQKKRLAKAVEAIKHHYQERRTRHEKSK